MYTSLAKQLLWLIFDYGIKYYFIKTETEVLYFSEGNQSFQHYIPILQRLLNHSSHPGDLITSFFHAIGSMLSFRLKCQPWSLPTHPSSPNSSATSL